MTLLEEKLGRVNKLLTQVNENQESTIINLKATIKSLENMIELYKERSCFTPREDTPQQEPTLRYIA